MNAQLKILTYNICALPNWLNQFSNPKKKDR